jgi:Tol biopolymer transport system component
MRFPLALCLLLACHPLCAAEPRQLTFDGRLKQHPVFVPDGTAVVYTVEADSPRLVLMKLDLEKNESARIHPKASLPEMKGTYSSDGQWFAYLKLTGNDTTAVIVADTKTNAERALKFSKPVPWDPIMAPAGGSVFLSIDGQIVSQSITATGAGDPMEKMLTKGSLLNNWPSVSPDGRQIAFSSARRGDYEIYVKPTEGGDARRLTESPRLDAHPAFSPTGKRIAFTSLRDGNSEIYVVRDDGTQLRRVTTQPERDDFAAWHPEANRLVIVREHDGRYDLYLVDLPRD